MYCEKKHIVVLCGIIAVFGLVLVTRRIGKLKKLSLFQHRT